MASLGRVVEREDVADQAFGESGEPGARERALAIARVGDAMETRDIGQERPERRG